MKRLAIEMFSILSRTLNVLTGGTADMTFSARSHRDGLSSEKWIDRFFQVVMKEAEHCRIWWLHEVERSAHTLNHPKAHYHDLEE